MRVGVQLSELRLTLSQLQHPSRDLRSRDVAQIDRYQLDWFIHGIPSSWSCPDGREQAWIDHLGCLYVRLHRQLSARAILLQCLQGRCHPTRQVLGC